MGTCPNAERVLPRPNLPDCPRIFLRKSPSDGVAPVSAVGPRAVGTNRAVHATNSVGKNRFDDRRVDLHPARHRTRAGPALDCRRFRRRNEDISDISVSAVSSWTPPGRESRGDGRRAGARPPIDGPRLRHAARSQNLGPTCVLDPIPGDILSGPPDGFGPRWRRARTTLFGSTAGSHYPYQGSRFHSLSFPAVTGLDPGSIKGRAGTVCAREIFGLPLQADSGPSKQSPNLPVN